MKRPTPICERPRISTHCETKSTVVIAASLRHGSGGDEKRRNGLDENGSTHLGHATCTRRHSLVI